MKSPVYLRHPEPKDRPAFLEAARLSRALHRPWVRAPLTSVEFRRYLKKMGEGIHRAYLVYDKASAGIEWLIRVLGLAPPSRYPTPDGSVAFAELGWRTGVVFVSSRPAADNPWSKVGVAAIALAAADAESVRRHFHHAVAAGAAPISRERLVSALLLRSLS